MRAIRFEGDGQQTWVEEKFELRYAKSVVTVPVPPDISILEALEWVGVFARGLVWKGICGMCETGVLDGTPEHRDYVLAPQERLDGENMMICRSRSLRLVLDLCWSATG